MFTQFRSIIIGTLLSTCALFGDSSFLQLKLKQNQQMEHLTTMGFDLYVDLPKEYVELTRKKIEANPTAETIALSLALSNMLREQPVLTGQVQHTRLSTVLETKSDHYLISANTNNLKFSLQENLLGNFSMAYNSKKPEKNFSNFPFPIDFTAIDKEMKNQSHLIMQVAKDGTLESISNLDQLIYQNTVDSQQSLTCDQMAQLAQMMEIVSHAITQVKAPSYITSIHLPKDPKEIGDSWSNQCLTVPQEWRALLPEEVLPALNLLEQNLTLVDRKAGVATFKIELPAKESLSITLPEGVAISIDGTLMKGLVKIDEATGVVADAELLTDYTIKFSKVKVNQSPQLDEMPDYIIVRLVATLGVESITTP